MVTDSDPGPSPEHRFPLAERILVLLIALAAFGYFLYRIFRPWEPWPEQTLWARIGEAIFMGIFLFWAVGFVLWPRSFGGGPSQPRDRRR